MANIDIPALPPPELMPENVNSGDGLMIMTWALLGISTVCVGGRTISKTYVLRRFRWDDVCLLLTWATYVVYTAALQMSYHHGLGRHSVYLGVEKSIKLIRWAYVCQVFCIVTPLLGRLAVTLYTVNLLGNAKAYMRHFLWVLLWLQIATNVSLLIVLLSLCGFDIPTVANPATTCYKQSGQSRYAEFVSGFNAATDGALTFTPILLIWGIQTTTRAKLAASFLLGFSALAMGAAIWRTIELDVIFAADWDFTHNSVPYFYASSFEQSSIMIAAAIPTFGPVFKRVRFAEPITGKGGSVPSSKASSPKHSTHKWNWEEDAQIKQNFSHALGIEMPGLGNTVMITAGGVQRSPRVSRRDSLGSIQLKTFDTKPTVRTDVKVESVPARPPPAYTFYNDDEDVEKLL